MAPAATRKRRAAANEVARAGAGAKRAAARLARAPTRQKNDALAHMAALLTSKAAQLLEANEADVKAAASAGMSSALVDRLILNEKRIRAMADGLLAVAAQPDPVGELIDEWDRPNGLRIHKVRVPLGVVAVIYEARPNVTADVASLTCKSGNAALLRGSSHALASNLAITRLLRAGAMQAGLPEDSIQLIEDTSREAAVELMRAKKYVDLLIPRGGPALIASIEASATVPTIIDGDGNCHVYVDRAADPEVASSIAMNAKVQRPGVCNAAETLLVHRDLAAGWLPGTLDQLAAVGVEIRGDREVLALWPSATLADEADWATEYLDLILAVRVVGSLGEAIAHINRWGTSNAEAIVSEDLEAARRFAEEVDSGTIFVNASTRFSDGGEFGYGAEIGISTQKLHARGPMGLRELTTFKYVVWGSGQIRS
ncbi:MAG: glutamate-5-semialdehyde dehydrogenase [Actinomycetota bacterium]